MNWQQDWVEFINSVGKDLDKADKPADLSRRYGGKLVHWVGTVDELQLDSEWPLVRMKMPPVNTQLSDGRHGCTDYLGLNLQRTSLSTWRDARVGSKVGFRARIAQANGPFPGIEWADVGNEKGYVSVAIDDAELLELIE